ncbi:hypothetical protein Scep_027656 [Stephania cephalantha]|uniref:Uncharacterized protein n=1 Tax=Stephania cephalantha TaxID=152367 RepID=A0AAP0HIQ1_9MAGN
MEAVPPMRTRHVAVFCYSSVITTGSPPIQKRHVIHASKPNQSHSDTWQRLGNKLLTTI